MGGMGGGGRSSTLHNMSQIFSLSFCSSITEDIPSRESPTSKSKVIFSACQCACLMEFHIFEIGVTEISFLVSRGILSSQGNA